MDSNLLWKFAMLYSDLGFIEDLRQTSDLYDLPNL